MASVIFATPLFPRRLSQIKIAKNIALSMFSFQLSQIETNLLNRVISLYKWIKSHICSPFQEEIISKQFIILLWFLKAFLSWTPGSVPIKLGSNKHPCVREFPRLILKKATPFLQRIHVSFRNNKSFSVAIKNCRLH